MRTGFALLTLVATASCVSAPPSPVSPRAPLVAPAPLPASPVVAPAGDWRDWPQTPGDWRYAAGTGGSTATFAGASGPLFAIRCVAATREVRLVRFDPNASPMTIRTSEGPRTLDTLITAGPPDGSAATLPAADPLLDAIAFSRGRFVVEQPNLAPLVLPAWAEAERVIEDCRG